jgi:hypothetical protein
MQMQFRMILMDGLQHLAVVLQLHLCSQPSLQAYFSGPLGLCLSRPAENLLGGEEIALALPERAETAGTGAFVGEVDIAIDHKGNVISAALLAKGIGEAEQTDGLLPEPHKLLSMGIWIDGLGMNQG